MSTYDARSSRRLLKAAERMIRRKKENSELLRSASTCGMSYPATRIGQGSLTLADRDGSSVRSGAGVDARRVASPLPVWKKTLPQR